MSFKEYANYDGMDLARLIKNKEVSPKEVLESAIERIEKLNIKLNAVITKTYDLAMKSVENGDPSLPFYGVPILLKDILQFCEGVRCTMGSKLLENFVPDYDSTFVERIKNAGAAILGRTNVPEFGLMATTEPKYYGKTKNPWDLKRSPGGSSGGSAAAVASRMVPIATGNDGGGSIRIPAASCGLFGLKPSRGRMPNGPINGEVWMGLVVEGFLTRSVRDSALMFDLTQGETAGAPYIIKPLKKPCSEAIKEEPDQLRIAINTESPYKGKVFKACKEATEKTAKLLEDLGHKVEEARPNINFDELAESYIITMFAEVKSELLELENVLGKKIKSSDIEISTWVLAKIGEFVPIWKLSWAKHVWDLAARKMGEFHKKYDLYLTPTMANIPAKLGELLPSKVEEVALSIINKAKLGKILSLDDIIEKVAYKQLHRVPFTQLANQTGQPAMNVPLYWTKDNLPIGIHFMAKFGDEETLFKVAAQLERVKPWKDKIPPIA